MVERVIGATRDFLAIGFFEKGAIASRAVCRIVTNLGGGRRGFGTGFMVTPSLLMTNNHVLASEDQAGRSVAEFNYQLTESGTPLAARAVRAEARPFLPHRSRSRFHAGCDRAALDQRNGADRLSAICPLIAAEGKILVRDPVNIVQHPKGELKQIVIRNNTLLDLPREGAARQICPLRDRYRAGIIRLPGLQRSMGGDRAAPLRRSAHERQEADTRPRGKRLAIEWRSRRHRLGIERGYSYIASGRFHQGRGRARA